MLETDSFQRLQLYGQVPCNGFSAQKPVQKYNSMSSGRAKSAPAQRRIRDESPTFTDQSHTFHTTDGWDGSSSVNASAMIDAKEQRKRAENDLQLIANRIALLRFEEQRSLEKMSETKARAMEILEYVPTTLLWI